jgi:RNA polymerase sigma-70 factor (ECF subfamily)
VKASPVRTAAPSEGELMRKLADGDLSALGELYDRYAEDVRRFVVRATGRLDVADDVTHDAFVALSDSARRYDSDHSVRSFIIGIAGKLVLRRRRRSAIALRLLSDLRGWLRQVDERTPEGAAAADEGLARYQRALERMSEAKRLAVVMADVEGLSGPEIAAALDIPVGTVWTRLHHGREELRLALGEEPLR